MFLEYWKKGGETMKKKNSMLAILLLLAVVVLGVGYALTADDLVINGTAVASPNTNFNVKLTSVEEGYTATSASVTENVGSMTVTLKNVGDSQSATFVISNTSPAGMGATYTTDMIKVYDSEGVLWTEDASKYFDITTSATGTGVIKSVDGTATVTVNVSLKQAAVDEVTEKFTVKVQGIEAVQE